MNLGLLNRFVGCLGRLQFAETEKLLRTEGIGEEEKAPGQRQSSSTSALLAVLFQLVGAESQYFLFSYLTPKFSFRKENNIRDMYLQMRTELVRIGETKQKSSSAELQSSLAQIAGKFAQLASIRAKLVEFYATLPAKEWRAFETDCFQQLMVDLERLAVGGEVELLVVPVRRELNVLRQLHGAQQAIAECNAVDALLLLNESRAILEDWFRCLDPQSASSTRPSGPSAFFPLFGSRRRSTLSRLGLLQFLLQFHHTMVAKFSLYFHDTLVAHCPHGEMRQAFTTPNSFLQLFQTFVRKSNAHSLCVLVNRIERDAPFHGFGYQFGGGLCSAATTALEGNGQEVSEAKPSGGAQKRAQQSGLSEKYPALLFLPSERRITASLGGTMASNSAGVANLRPHTSEYATICAFVQEGCGNGGGAGTTERTGGGGSNSNSNDRLAESGKIRYLYDRNKDQTFFTAHIEANIHLVVTFERKVQERESVVHSFFNEALPGLRGTRLFQQEMRNAGK